MTARTEVLNIRSGIKPLAKRWGMEGSSNPLQGDSVHLTISSRMIPRLTRRSTVEALGIYLHADGDDDDLRPRQRGRENP
jgi:hypothetical protein